MFKQLELSQRPRVYFAGPDVFRPDANDHFQQLAQLCERIGLHAVVPADLANFRGTDREKAEGIYKANTQLLRTVHGVVANLRDFRGLEPDAGTAFEVGFASALQLPVIAYGAPAESYAERVRSRLPCEQDEEGVLRERGTRVAVEDFDLQLNLMLSCSVVFENSAERAIQRMAQLLAPLATAAGRQHDRNA